MPRICVPESSTLAQAASEIIVGGSRVVFIVGSRDNLLASLSEGDVIKAIARSASPHAKAIQFANLNPVFFGQDYNEGDLQKAFMVGLHQAIPICDADRRVLEIITVSEFLSGHRTNG